MSVVTPGKKVMIVAGISNINFYTYVKINIGVLKFVKNMYLPVMMWAGAVNWAHPTREKTFYCQKNIENNLEKNTEAQYLKLFTGKCLPSS